MQRFCGKNGTSKAKKPDDDIFDEVGRERERRRKREKESASERASERVSKKARERQIDRLRKRMVCLSVAEENGLFVCP